jgi:predicted component of type VI protein secretion system
MDQSLSRAEAGGRPQLRLHGDGPKPLRLVLQPSGMALEVDKPEAVIGRHTDADVRLPLPDVSRRHCKLAFTGAGWQVIDLNSLNGIQVNGEQVLQAPLEHGDTLRVGGFTFSIDLSGAPAAPGSVGHVQSILDTLTSPVPSRKAS